MYTRYQNLWTDFCAKNNVRDEYNDVALVSFFEGLKGRYDPSTKWVIFSCINSRMIDIYCVNLKGLPRLHKYIKMQTQLYVAKKSKTFDAKQIHHILTVLKDSDEPKKTPSCGHSTIVLQPFVKNKVKKLTVDNVTIKLDPKEIEVTFYHARKRRNEGLTFNVLVTFYNMFVKYVKQLCTDAVKQK